MKKLICLFIIVLFLFMSTQLALAEKSDKKIIKKSEDRSVVTKTYFLKHIDPRDVGKALSLYLYNRSYDINKKMLCVSIPKKNITKFEELLRKLDVKKRNIYFRIFTVIASQTGKSSEIKNKDLKRVIYELNKVLSFNCFKLDGVSLVSVQEGARRSVVNLSTSTKSRLELILQGITINGNEKGKRFIEIEGLSLRDVGIKLITTSTSINENGYLVVGVSKIGENGDSLILVINAEIK
jgi:hypothetical protein